MKTKDILDSLKKAEAVIIERSDEYENAHIVHAEVLAAMFPNGIELKSISDFSKFATLNMCVAKTTRYAMNFNKGGHKDSALDLISYAAMLEVKTKCKE